MKKFRIPNIPPTTNKSIRFPNDVIDEIENAIRGTDCTFSAFVVEAVRVALENLKEESLEYEGFHDCVSLRIRGRLPKDKERMCRQLDAAARRLEGKPSLYAWSE